MNVLCLSPHFPPNFANFAKSLAAVGVTALGIGDAPVESLPHDLRAALARYVYLPRMAEYDALLRATGGLIADFGLIDRVDGHIEFWLALEAKLREDFHIPGQLPSDLARNRSKWGMKQAFRAAGVPCGDGIRVESAAQVRAYVAEHGFPLVFKPDVGVGAARTFRVNTPAELDDALAGPLDDYVVESFLTGELVSFDGLAGRDGAPLYATSHVFNAGIMEVVAGRLAMHYHSVRDIPPALEALGRKVLQAFGIRERFFHIEFFRLPDGSYKALEVNVRPPGGYSMDMMNIAADIDLYGLWARMIAGHDVSGFRAERRYHACHVSRRFGRAYRHTHEAVLAELGERCRLHGPMPEAYAGAMGDYFYLVRDASLDDLRAAVAFVEALPPGEV